MKYKFVIKIVSKSSGDYEWLQQSYDVFNLAVDYTEQEVCLRCNHFEIHPIPESWQWINRKLGFQEMKGVGVAGHESQYVPL